MKKLAIITTHPIQYYAPIFKLLQQRGKIQIKVFYTMGENAIDKLDHGFNKPLKWDVPLLDGYEFMWLKNTSPNPGSHRFNGIINPDAVDELKLWNPDGLMVFGWAYNSHLKILRYFKGKIPIYFRGDSTLLNEPYGIKKIAKSIFLAWVYKHVDYAFYVGTNNKAYYKKYGLKDVQLTFAPHAIDNDRFNENRAEQATKLRLSLNIRNADIMILFAGKFEPVKDVDLLLSAFINLNRKNVHLLLVGNGVNEDKLKYKATHCAIAGNIHFLDFRNQSYMPVVYQAADLFCLPSKSETWGLSINEAMACGKAILASDKIGAAMDLVKSEQNGAIFASGDVNKLSQKLQQLTLNKVHLLEFGEQSRIIIKDWNFANIACAIEDKLAKQAN